MTDKVVAVLGLVGGDLPAAASSVVVPGPAEGVWRSRDLGERPPELLGAAWWDSPMLSPTGVALVSRVALPAVALALSSLLMDTSSVSALPRAGNDVVGTCSAAVTSITTAGAPGASAEAWGWVTALAPGSSFAAAPGAALWWGEGVSPVPGTAALGSWGERAGGG